MPRFYVPKDAIRNNVAEITGEDIKHIRKVLRLRTGDPIILFDDTGSEYHGVLGCGDSKGLSVEIIKKAYVERESPIEIILGQALAKFHKMDFVVQKITELGATEFIPFHSNRSVVKLDEDKLAKKRDRWQKIALEATKQCGRNKVTRISPPVNLNEIFEKQMPGSLKLIPWEGDKTLDLKGLLNMNSDKKKFFVLVGPEGGFTKREIQEAKEAGFHPVSMGNRILRSETASISIVSVIQHRFGDLH